MLEHLALHAYLVHVMMAAYQSWDHYPVGQVHCALGNSKLCWDVTSLADPLNNVAFDIYGSICNIAICVVQRRQHLDVLEQHGARRRWRWISSPAGTQRCCPYPLW